MIRGLVGRAVGRLRRWLGGILVRDAIRISGRIRVDVHDVADCRRKIPDWDDLSKAERAKAVERVDPARTFETTNTTVEGLHEYHVDDLDPNQSADIDLSHLGVGTDDTTPVASNSSLNSETNRYSIRSSTDKANDLQTKTFLDTSEENGNTLKEVALFSAATGGTMANHALISDVEKNDTKTVTITVTLEYRAA